MGPTKLIANRLQLTAGREPILRDLSLTLHPYKLTALVGPNGAGKSTLLRTLASIETRYTGEICLGTGTPVATLSPKERARTIGFVGSHETVPFSFTTFETVRLGRYAWHQGNPSKDDDRKSHQFLELMGLERFSDRPVTTLSSGERQKTMIARLLAGETPILLLDEPLANLDVGASLKLLMLLKKIAHDGGTVCLSIHDLNLAYSFADRVICMDKGHIIADGDPTQILLSPEVRQAFSVHTRVAPGLRVGIHFE
jgi:ABC-type cobalamin/Fe3+-siderophores transport system ATPase subunit